MTPELAIQIVRQALIATLWLSAPLLLIGFLVAIVINFIQIATSMQDTAFSTIPRLAAFVISLLLLMPWMLRTLTTYTIGIFGDLSRYAR